MDFPTYVKEVSEENYHEELNQTLIQGLSNNGWTVAAITSVELATEVTLPNGKVGTLADYMPNGTLWYLTDLDKLIISKSVGLQEIPTIPYP